MAFDEKSQSATLRVSVLPVNALTSVSIGVGLARYFSLTFSSRDSQTVYSVCPRLSDRHCSIVGAHVETRPPRIQR